tara:strand:+ start:51 stop:764 length:714 start_codon:yes stop_codon:yes gene_type:complete
MAETKSAKKAPAKEVSVSEPEVDNAESNTAIVSKDASNVSIFNENVFDASDIEIPRLNVIQKMSQIEGDVGSVSIDKDAQLVPASTKVPVIVVGGMKRWQEDIPFEEEGIPKTAMTKEESMKLAQESDYKVIELAEIVLLIPQNDLADEGLFPFPIGEENFAIGKMTVQKDAYRMTYKRMKTFELFNGDTPVHTVYWKFSTELMTKGRYSWFVPTLTSTKETTPKEVQEFIARMHGA